MERDYNLEKRKYVIGASVIVIVLIYLIRLFTLQIMSEDYKKNADSNAFLNKTQYPSRGVMYDRNGNLLVYNQPAYDVTMVMKEVHNLDTLDLCKTLNITPDYFKKRKPENNGNNGEGTPNENRRPQQPKENRSQQPKENRPPREGRPKQPREPKENKAQQPREENGNRPKEENRNRESRNREERSRENREDGNRNRNKRRPNNGNNEGGSENRNNGGGKENE